MSLFLEFMARKLRIRETRAADIVKAHVVEAGPCVISVERRKQVESDPVIALGFENTPPPRPPKVELGMGVLGRAAMARACLLAMWSVTLHLSIGVLVPFAGISVLAGALLPLLFSGALGRGIVRSRLRLHQLAGLAWFGCMLGACYVAWLPARYEHRDRDELQIGAADRILAAVLDSWIFQAFVLVLGFHSAERDRFEGLAALFGLEVRCVPLSCRRGYLVDCGGVRSIFVSDALVGAERGEVILHELAHFLLRHVLAAPLDLVVRGGVSPELRGAQQERDADSLAGGVIAAQASDDATPSFAPVRGPTCRNA